MVLLHSVGPLKRKIIKREKFDGTTLPAKLRQTSENWNGYGIQPICNNLLWQDSLIIEDFSMSPQLIAHL